MDIMNSLKNSRDMIDSLIANKTQSFASATIPAPLDELQLAAQECVGSDSVYNSLYDTVNCELQAVHWCLRFIISYTMIVLLRRNTHGQSHFELILHGDFDHLK